MTQLKITKIKNKNGTIKEDFMCSLRKEHPDMIGKCIVNPHVDGYFLLDWLDDSGKILRTSKIIRMYYDQYENRLRITTKNSVYECDLLED